MTTTRANVICLLFIATVIAIACFLYSELPQQIPTHWNIEGEIDDYTEKPWGVIVMPLVAILAFAIMRLIPVISPKGFRTDKFMDVINVFTVTLVGFLSGVGILVLLQASGRDVHINAMIFAGIGLLLIVLGNYMGKIRKNFFIGIRTPWTLASDEVWSRTHRLGGRVFVLLGLFLMLNSFFDFREAWLAGVIVVTALIPFVYSFLLYRRLEGFGPDEDEDLADDSLEEH